MKDASFWFGLDFLKWKTLLAVGLRWDGEPSAVVSARVKNTKVIRLERALDRP